MAKSTSVIVQAAMPPSRRGRGDKREAIISGALSVFARDGYTRASIEAIAAAAEVSTRTIYNHFQDKAHLFESVIQASAARAADAQINIIDRHLRKVTDLEADLIEFGLELALPMPHLVEHFALVRQVNAEAAHIPPAAIVAWQQIGPLRVRQELARHLAQLADRGLLAVDDADRAALHLLLLVSASNPSYPAAQPSQKEIVAAVTAGVHAFLHGYLTPRSRRRPSGQH